ncbi:MAG: HIT family protein [Polyangiaceae bacterium]
MAACIFCRIVAGELAAEVVLDEPPLLAFLDHRPLFPGHVLLVPREHHETLLDLPPALSAPLLDATRRLSAAVLAALDAEGFFVAMNNKVSQSVPHLHVHVIPRRKKDGLKGFFWPRVGYRDAAHMAEVGAAIRAAYQRTQRE